MHQATQMNLKRQFSCKICGTAQSIKAVLGSATSGRDLRGMVQELNMRLQGEDRAREEAQRAAAAVRAAPPPGQPGGPPAAPPAGAADARWSRFCGGPAAPPAAGGPARDGGGP